MARRRSLGVLLLLGLVILLTVTGTFGREIHRDAAQAVLSILFGRKQPKDGSK